MADYQGHLQMWIIWWRIQPSHWNGKTTVKLGCISTFQFSEFGLKKTSPCRCCVVLSRISRIKSKIQRSPNFWWNSRRNMKRYEENRAAAAAQHQFGRAQPEVFVRSELGSFPWGELGARRWAEAGLEKNCDFDAAKAGHVRSGKLIVFSWSHTWNSHKTTITKL